MEKGLVDELIRFFVASLQTAKQTKKGKILQRSWEVYMNHLSSCWWTVLLKLKLSGVRDRRDDTIYLRRRLFYY